MIGAVWRWRFPVDPQRPEPVVLQVSGPVSVQAHPEAEVVVKAVGKGQRTGRTVQVQGPVKVMAPPYAVLHLVDSSGPFKVEGLTQGGVRLTRVSGPVRVHHVAWLEGAGVQGPIRATEVSERLRIESSTGPLKVVGLPRGLQAQIDGLVQMEAATLDGQQVQVRASRAVLVQVPASTAVQGRVEAPEVWVDLTGQARRGAGAFDLQAPNPDLRITAASDVAVYLGPEPPAAWKTAGDAHGWSGLWRWLTRGWRQPRVWTRVSAAAAAEGDLAAARRRVLDMLAAGKLSAEEAAELLEALEEAG